MSRALCRRIFEHAIAEGWLKPGDVVADPFGGIGGTALTGAEFGVQVFSCELEPKFVALHQQNIEKHRWRWQQFKRPIPVVVQGDSRRLREVLAAADCVVSSPPFAGEQTGGGIAAKNGTDGNIKTGANCGYQNQATSPGNLAGMVVGSPPYAEIASGSGGLNTKPGKDGQQSGRSPGSASQDTDSRYGDAPGQLAKMVVGSPPFEGSVPHQDADFTTRLDGSRIAGAGLDYGTAAGQLGNDTGETFWSAAREILQQCHQILKPGGHAIWVCKDFVRKGKRVPFSDDWLRLCEAVGFVFVCRHRAMLVSETVDAGLFGTVTKKRERKSFFRRLAEKKGSPEINWEDVICVRK